MPIPVAANWVLLAVFVLLAIPSVYRMVRAVPGQAGERGLAGRTGREIDLIELLMMLAMAAMVSPLGGPIPAAGWEAVLLLTAGWSLVAAVRGRRAYAVHNTIAAAAMLYMLAAMPAEAMDHGPWFAMPSSARLAVPALAALGAAYFSYDAVRIGRRAIRNARVAGVRDVTFARPACRAVMGAGMAYLLGSAVL
ncbi:DUF5134 domain-containing protein [Amycolatopsis taiwanensis]|uniref:DUF5134 domain-containing protein n=1 Tax=Amycolatopsis taiwanensis TaxID=342230 RepID=UPI000480463E|nr:DUF5134 domain-containing protein [Amycolatopsis taiwanensis]